MKKSFKIIALITALVLLVSAVFAGCSTNSSDSGSSGDTLKVGVIQYMAHSSLDNCYAGVKQALDNSGLNIEIDYQIGSSGSADADCQSYAANMVAQNYDLIIAIATPAATAAYSAVTSASSSIPVIFCAVSDPISAGLVQSLDAPGNNCSGTADTFDVESQVELIRALQPDVQNLGVIYTTTESNSLSQLERLQTAADAAGINVVAQGINDASELAAVSASLVTRVDAITNLTDNNVVDNMSVVMEQANAAGIPVYGSEIEQVRKGCIAAASLDYVALGNTTGEMAVRVLNGESAAAMPVITVADSEMVVNTDVLNTMSITLPASLENAQQVTTSTEE